jgi:hypothetical protein
MATFRNIDKQSTNPQTASQAEQQQTTKLHVAKSRKRGKMPQIG